MIAPLVLGLTTALAPASLLACLTGVVLGTLVGVLPGVGPVTTIALLLPVTFTLPPTPSVIMLAGIYYGAQYGGSITAILLNLPGEASSAVTCLDGHAMARQGRGRLALAVAALASFVGGTVGTLLVAMAAQPLSALASRLDAADFAALMAFALVVATVTAQGTLPKAAVMTLAGVLLGAVGTDVARGEPRWTFGVPDLVDGIGFLPVAIGLFGLAEIIAALSTDDDSAPALTGQSAWRPGEVGRAVAATARGTLVGSVLGIVPGGGPTLASFAAYAAERAFARGTPRLGAGAIEGVASPEAANNAAAQSSFVPLLTLGIPTNAVVALLLGALVMQGIQPGPQIVTREPALFWGLIASMWLGNVMLLVLNLPLVGLWVRVLHLPRTYLYPATFALSCAGVYVVNDSTIDVLLAALFGVAGTLVRARGFEPTPLLLGFIVSRPLEENLQRALVFADGDLTTFARHPVSAGLLVMAAAAAVVAVVTRRRSRRGAAANAG